MTAKRDQRRKVASENRRLKAALAAIHDALHRDDVNGAHEACECAIEGQPVNQPNVGTVSAANAMTFAAAFNSLAESHGVKAACVMLLPSATKPGYVSIQICGEVTACKVVEAQMRGVSSTYMGDHDEPSAPEPVEYKKAPSWMTSGRHA